MASGFLFLHDGRCLAVRWAAYDDMLRAVSFELDRNEEERELAAWLNTLLPGPEDVELGYAWIPNGQDDAISRDLDIRALTQANQQRFNKAARRALGRMLLNNGTSPIERGLLPCLNNLVSMIDAAERGEPPLEMSDTVTVEPPSGERLGPGWGTADRRGIPHTFRFR